MPTTTPIAQQIANLARLLPGWFDGEGTAYHPQFLQDTSEFLQATLPPDFSAPYIYPSVDGSIQAEWDIFDWAISLSIAPLPADSLPPRSPNGSDSLSATAPAQQAPINNALSVELHALHLPTNTVRAQTFLCIAALGNLPKPGHCSPGAPPRHSVLEARPLRIASAAGS